MVRTQIQLTDDQSTRLKRIATQENISVAELIRRSVDAFLKDQAVPAYEERMKRALLVVGKYTSGTADISEDHDKYLSESYAQGGR